MAKEQFVSKLRLNKKNEAMLIVINDIIDEYASQGYKLTLRQLYYQLVSRAIVPNAQSEYAKLSSLLVKGRMFGAVDWDAIEDRLRRPRLPYWVHDIKDAINDTVETYRIDRQKGQEVYIELWVEKDALSGVLSRITSYYHVRLMVNRGYSSCSAMHDAYRRFSYSDNSVILYLGDHDPSGLDMVRDIEQRLEDFGVYPKVLHIGLTMEQIDKYKPPPNPAKITDPRATQYIAEHGRTSWEVDALNPDTLHKLVKKNIEKLIDKKLFLQQIEKEEADKQRLREIADDLEV